MIYICYILLWIVHFYEDKVKRTSWSRFPTASLVVLVVVNGLWWEVGVRFVDIRGIVDHHCLNFLFIIFTIDKSTYMYIKDNHVQQIENSIILLKEEFNKIVTC